MLIILRHRHYNCQSLFVIDDVSVPSNSDWVTIYHEIYVIKLGSEFKTFLIDTTI
jgi:hypothetical protein